MTLLDVMIVVAGIAASLWARPEGWETDIRTAIRVGSEYRSVRLAVHWTSNLLVASQPIFAVWTLTVLVLGLRQRRPALRRLSSQPGVVAFGAATLTMLMVCPLRIIFSRSNLVHGLPILVWFQIRIAEALTFEGAGCGIAVAAAWMVLLLGGRWRPRPTLIERIGQACGYLWVATIPITWVRLV
jgi:hypothetical protein